MSKSRPTQIGKVQPVHEQPIGASFPDALAENSAKPCDTGSLVPEIQADFPDVNFSDVDPVWPDKTSSAGRPYAYTRKAILERGQRGLVKLYDRPEKFIFVISHSGFLRLGVVGC